MSYLSAFLTFISGLFSSSASGAKDLAEAQAAMSETLNNLSSRVLMLERERVDLVGQKAALAGLLARQLESNRLLRNEMTSLRQSNQVLHEDNKALLKHNRRLEAMIASCTEDMASVTQEMVRPEILT